VLYYDAVVPEIRLDVRNGIWAFENSLAAAPERTGVYCQQPAKISVLSSQPEEFTSHDEIHEVKFPVHSRHYSDVVEIAIPYHHRDRLI
jgi:hypothetical protein